MPSASSRRNTTPLVLGILLAIGTVHAPARAQTLTANLIYTSIQPCRLVDTRAAGGTILPGSVHARTFNIVAVAAPGSLNSQGGNPNGCPIPGFSSGPQVQAVELNFVAVGPTGPGDLRAWPTDQTLPNAAILNYASGTTLANAVILPVRQDHSGADITVQADVSGTDLVVDVLGYFSSATPTAGQDNLFLGFLSGNASTTGFQNTALGNFSLERNTSGLQNVALGASALSNNSTGLANTAVGAGALESNTSGTHNTAIGLNSLSAIASASSNNNTAVGFFAVRSITDGYNNTAVGVGALQNSTGGTSNIAIGFNAGASLNAGETSNIEIGNTGVAGESNTIRIGTFGTHSATFIAGINGNTSSSGTAVFVNTQGQLGTTTSSLRYKEDIRDMGTASNNLMRLRPVTFHYRSGLDDGSHLLQYGLIAEEVAQIDAGLVQFDPDGQPATVRYHFVNAMLLNEVQKQHQRIAGQDARLASQQAEIARLETRLAEQEKHAAELEWQLRSLLDRLGPAPSAN